MATVTENGTCGQTKVFSHIIHKRKEISKFGVLGRNFCALLVTIGPGVIVLDCSFFTIYNY